MEAKKLSARATHALEVLRAGGKFRKALETDRFTRREQFQTRLLEAGGHVVSGIGFATRVELEAAGLICYQHPHDARCSAWPEEWVLRMEVAPADEHDPMDDVNYVGHPMHY